LIRSNRVKPFDEEVPTLIGDLVHNLRSALDHAYNICIEMNGKSVNYNTKFPFFNSEGDLRASINKIISENKHQPCAGVLQIIKDEIQPFVGGRLDIHGLNKLSNADKHSHMIPMIGAFHSKYMQLLDMRGDVVNELINMTILFDPLSDTKIFGRESDDCFFLVEAAKVNFDQNPLELFTVKFKEGHPYENLDIIPVLFSLLEATTTSIAHMHEAMVNGLIDQRKALSTVIIVDPATGKETKINSANLRPMQLAQTYKDEVFPDEPGVKRDPVKNKKSKARR
jgi:hypothetical protein